MARLPSLEELEALRQHVRNLEETLAADRLRRREAEAKANDWADQVRTLRAELEILYGGIRYRLGHALILALRPSSHTLALPVRLVALFREGLRRWRNRRTARGRRTQRPRGHSSRNSVDPEIERALDPTLPDHVPAEPFGRVPIEHVQRPQLQVAAIADEFSWRCWQYEADFHALTPGSWRSVVEADPPRLLMVESSWFGPSNCWEEQLTDLDRKRALWLHPAIDDILAWCRRRGIPTVFLNKEDPTHFDVFLALARGFDAVLTSDADSVDAYRSRLGHSRVFVAPLAAQPRLHNPVLGRLARSRRACFAGTWYAVHHSERQRAAEAILLPALELGLDIFGRLDETAPPAYRWPPAYQKALRGTLPYVRMISAYKLYRAALNLNSIIYSPTMASRRLFEVLACGTPVISSYARSIRELLGEDVVLVSDDPATTRRHLESLLGDEDERERRSLRGLRKVFAEHTYGHRMGTVLRAAGITDPDPFSLAVAVLAPVATPDEALSAWRMFERQEHSDRRLVLCGRSRELPSAGLGGLESDPRVRWVVDEERGWGSVLHQALESCEAEWVALVNPRDHYGANYLTDYVHATRYAARRAMGKAEYFQLDSDGVLERMHRDQAYRYTAEVAPWSLFAERSHLLSLAGHEPRAGSAEEWALGVVAAASAHGLYAADPFNYVRVIGAGSVAPVGFSSPESSVGEALHPALV